MRTMRRRLADLERRRGAEPSRRQDVGMTPDERRCALLSILGYSMDEQAELTPDEKRHLVGAVITARNQDRLAAGLEPLLVDWNQM